MGNRDGDHAKLTTARTDATNTSARTTPLTGDLEHLPTLLTVEETAALLRTTPKAIYSMHERRQLPGAVKVRRRLLFSRTELVRWLEQNRVPSLEGSQR